MSTVEQLAQSFTELSRALRVGERQDIAERVTTAATKLTPGCQEAAMCLVDRHGQAWPSVATDESVATADRVWHEIGDGPCLTAIRTGAMCGIPDLLRDEHWPAPSRQIARTTTIRCVLALPVVVDADNLGALTLAARSAHAFGTASVRTGELVAVQAALALTDAATRAANASLEEALQSSRLIGMAVGIVMAQRVVTSEQAFDLLRIHSRRDHRRVRDLAEEIVETGRLP